jgi:hypothetical protein
MAQTTALKAFFWCVLLVMLAVSIWASTQQPIQQWGGLRAQPDRWWTLATLMDAYCGFLTFYAWVLFKEPRWLPRLFWFVAIMLLGNMAMATYALRQLSRLRPGQHPSAMLTTRNA